METNKLSGIEHGSGATTSGNTTEDKEAATDLIISDSYKRVPEPMPYFVFPFVTYLYFGNKQLKEVPNAILAMRHIVKLDLSNNFITYFDQIPVFIDKIQELSLAKNALLAPPLWIWKEKPSKLRCLDLSGNSEVVSTLKEQGKNVYFESKLDIYRILLVNCNLHTCTEFIHTLYGVKELILGGGDMLNYNGWNELYEFPLESLTCYGARIINLNNCQIYDIRQSITDYSSVAYLDLGVNYIECLPEEFGYLTDLEICILSSNKLETLPASIINLKKLRILFLSNNKIEYLPERLFKLPKLKCVDLYDNCVDALPEGYENMDEFDFAQNYANEPDQSEYTDKRAKLRKKHTKSERINEKKSKPEYDDWHDREGSPIQTWEGLPFSETSGEDIESSEEEVAEQLGFEYVTEETCVANNKPGSAQSEDEFVILDPSN